MAWPSGNFSGPQAIINWQRRKKITIKASQIGADMTSPVLFVDLAEMPSTFWSNVQSSGQDIRVTKSDETTELEHDVAYINTGTNKGALFVRFNGTLSSTVDTDIWIYYDYSLASAYAPGATYGRNNCWQDYDGVYLPGADGYNAVIDRTGNNASALTVEGSMTSGDEVEEGPFNIALDFDGSNDALEGGDRHDMNADDITFEAIWAGDRSSAGAAEGIFSKANGSSADGRWSIFKRPNATPHELSWNLDTGVPGDGFSGHDAAGTIGQYYHQLGTVQRGSALRAFLDGVLEGTAPANSSTASRNTTIDFVIGRYQNSSNVADRWFDGRIAYGGFRRSYVSDDDVLSEYKNKTDNANFIDFTIAEEVQSASAPTFTVTDTDVDCNGADNGEILIEIDTGSGPFDYVVKDSGGATVQSALSSPLTSYTFTGLVPDTYSVEVTNAGGTTTETGIVISEPAALLIGVTPTAVNCNGGSDGEIAVTYTGGAGPIDTIVLKDSGGTILETLSDSPPSPSSFTGLSADTYTVEVTDANGCVTSDTGVVTEPSAIAITPTITNETAVNAEDGEISFAITGGTTPFDVSLYTAAGVFVERKTAQTSPVVFTSLAPDTYDAFVNDSATSKTFAGGDAINDWTHRAKITLQSSQISADLTDYVATIFFDDLPADFFNQVKTDGSDIRFTKGDGFTELEFYVHAIDTVAGTGYASVRYAGTLSSTVDTDIYIYYGNASALAYAAGATYGRNNTFQDYAAFWDFEQNPSGSAPQLTDLTGNGNDGTSQGSMTSGDEVAGKVGNAWDFDGTNDYADLGTPSFASNTSGTLGGWLSRASGARAFTLSVITNDATLRLFDLRVDPSAASVATQNRFVIRSRITTSLNTIIADGVVIGTEDRHFTLVSTGSAWSLYLDSASQSFTSTSGSNTGDWFGDIGGTTPTYGIGGNDVVTGDSNNSLIWLRSDQLASDYITTEYANQNSPSTFYSVGSQETPQYFATGCFASEAGAIVTAFSAGVFGTKYRIEFTSDLNFVDWRIDIEKANYSSTVTTLKAGPNPLRITRGKGGDFDKYIEIYPSTATFEVWVETEAALRELITENEEEYRIKIYRDPDGTNLLFWVGQFVSDLYQEAYQGTPYLLQLKAVDGLARLKNLEYLDSNDDYIEGNATLYDIIKEALNGLQSYFLADKLIEVLNVWDDNFSQVSGQSVLKQTYTDQGAYINQTENSKSALAKYDVLKNIAGSFGARLFYEFDTFNETPCFYIQRVNELNQTSIARAEIDLTTDGVTTSNRATVQELKTKNAIEGASGNVYEEVTFVRADHLLRFGPAVKKVTVRFKPENIKNATYNNILSGGEFEYRQPQSVNDWDDGAGNDSTTTLRDWTGAGGGVVRQSFAALNYASEPGSVANAYGAKFATVATQGDIESDPVTVNDGFGGSTNVLNFAFRFFYLVDSWVTNRDQVTVNPKVQIEIKVGSNYLQNDLTWDTSPDFVEFDLGSSALQDINGVTIPGARTNVNFKADVPSGGGALTVRILQNEANDGSGSIGRIVSLTTSGTAVENTTLVVEFARCVISNSDGEVGSESVEYLTTNSINATADDIEKEYIHGDAADGQGFNAGVYQLSSGAPTDSWSRTGEADNLTLLKFLSRAIINNYDEISLKLEGTFFEGNGKLRFDKIYQLDETINAATVTRYLLPLFIDINFKTEFARCEFVQNLDGFTAYNEEEISQPSGAGQIGSG